MKRIWVIAVISAGVLVVLTGAVAYMVSSETKYIRIPAVAFRPSSSNIRFTHGNNGQFLALPRGELPSSAAPIKFYAPVVLPDGATIKAIEFHYLDPGPGKVSVDFLTVLGSGVEYPNSAVKVAATTGMSTDSPEDQFKRKDWNTTNFRVDQYRWTYLLRASFHSDASLAGDAKRVHPGKIGFVKIIYTLPTPLSRIMSRS